MSYKFSNKSQDKLTTVAPEIQRVMHEVIKHIDFTVISGKRSNIEQAQLYADGLTHKKPGTSKHEAAPLADAIDIAPYPVDWDDWTRFYFLGGFVMATAKQMGVELRWGGDWNGDHKFKDERFKDLGHFELVRKKAGAVEN